MDSDRYSQRRYSGSGRSAGPDGPRRPKKKRGLTIRIGGRRYRLVYPERLLLFLIILVTIIVIVVMASRHSRKGQPGASASSSEAVSEVSTIPSSSEKETGTVRSGTPITLDSLKTQMTSYMAGLVYSNPYNYKRTSSTPNGQGAEAEVDLSHYRYVVAVNPACGGSESGWVSGTAVEKVINLTIARGIVDYCNSLQQDYYFFLVRDADKTMTNAQRLKVIEAYEPDLIINIHCNGSEEELGGAVGKYTLTGTYSEGGSEEGEEAEEPKYTTRDRLSMDLAQKLMEEAAGGLGEWYRYIENDEEDIMLQTDVPSVSIYLGFITYSLDNGLLQDEGSQAACEKAMGDALLEFCKTNAPEKTRGEIRGEQLESSQTSEESQNPDESSVSETEALPE